MRSSLLRACALAALLLLSRGAAAADVPDVAAVLKAGAEAQARGELRAAIEGYEAFADAGGLHPDVSHARGVAYLARARGEGAQPGDLGRAAAAFDEASWLDARDEAAERAAELVRAEVARRRSRGGQAMEVTTSPSLLRAVSTSASEQVWALVSMAASLVLALGLALRRSEAPRVRLASGVAVGLGALSLLFAGVLVAHARHLRRDVSDAVVVVSECYLADEKGAPIAGLSVPEGARVEVDAARGGLLRVSWGNVAGWAPFAQVRVVRPASQGYGP